MNVGDLISFKPASSNLDEWSNPCIVVREWEHLDQNKQPIWVLWCDGYEVIVDAKYYEIMYLTTS